MTMFQRFLNIDINQMRFMAFLSAIIIYAFWGLPTPDNPGAVEGIIGGLLIIAVGASGFLSALKIDSKNPVWQSVGRWLLIYGLSVPVIIALVQGQDSSLIIRDIIPFLFMLLPIFLWPYFLGNHKEERRFKALLIAILILGIVFALRASAEHVYTLKTFLFLSPSSGELTYLSNAPTILFTMLFLTGLGAKRLIATPSFKNSVLFVFCIIALLITFTPLVLSVQRASLGYGALYGLILAAVSFFYYPRGSALFFLLIALALIPFYGALEGLIDLALQKTRSVGLNMRFEEMAAIWHEASGSWVTVLFGEGWGASFESPAVGGVRVNFTHSLITSAFLKTGLIGMALVVFYIFSILRLLLNHVRRDIILPLALVGPILIDTFLYASFKSLDFGLLLLLTIAIPQVAKPR